MSDSELLRLVQQTGVPSRIQYREVDGRIIRYFITGTAGKPSLILLHGSPSSLSAWRDLFTDSIFLHRYQLIAFDRPGYGYSDFGRTETNLQKQVSLIQPIVDSLTVGKGAILLGSSYGGPVAAQLAMNLPDRFRQLVLLSASVEPNREKTYYISYAMVLPVLKYLFPPTFRMSSEEKMTHAEQLQTLQDWSRIKADVLLIHGNRDDLIYYENALYARKWLSSVTRVTLVTMNGKGHSIIFSRPDFIKKILLARLYN
jgi:pimeloyl-ACP methyl ester carboxylesterase